MFRFTFTLQSFNEQMVMYVISLIINFTEYNNNSTIVNSSNSIVIIFYDLLCKMGIINNNLSKPQLSSFIPMHDQFFEKILFNRPEFQKKDYNMYTNVPNERSYIFNVIFKTFYYFFETQNDSRNDCDNVMFSLNFSF